MKILVCGSRYWADKKTILSTLQAYPQDSTLIHGGCRGADNIANDVAKSLGWKILCFPAEWDKYGTRAGPIRNSLMLAQNPDTVIAFHDDLSSSRGTIDTVNKAHSLSIEVTVVKSQK